MLWYALSISSLFSHFYLFICFGSVIIYICFLHYLGNYNCFILFFSKSSVILFVHQCYLIHLRIYLKRFFIFSKFNQNSVHSCSCCNLCFLRTSSNFLLKVGSAILLSFANYKTVAAFVSTVQYLNTICISTTLLLSVFHLYFIYLTTIQLLLVSEVLLTFGSQVSHCPFFLIDLTENYVNYLTTILHMFKNLLVFSVILMFLIS